MKKILYYAINGTGLGHLTRILAIAHCVRESTQHQLIITNSQYAELLRAVGIPFLLVPPSVDDPSASPYRHLQSLDSSIQKEIIFFSILSYQPDLIVFDTHFSIGLIKHLQTFRQHKLVLILRLTKLAYVKNLLDNNILPLFSLIIFPHTLRHVKKVLGDKIVKALKRSARISFVGPVTRNAISLPTTFKIPQHSFGLITCGGGGHLNWTFLFFKKVIKAACSLQASGNIMEIVIVLGPNLMNHKSKILSLFPTNSNITVIDHALDLSKLYKRAKIIITHAGYNSVNELLEVGAPSIFVPLGRLNENQATHLYSIDTMRVWKLSSSIASLIAKCNLIMRSKQSPKKFTGAKKTSQLLLQQVHARNKEAVVTVTLPRVQHLLKKLKDISSLDIVVKGHKEETLIEETEMALININKVKKSIKVSIRYYERQSLSNLPTIVQRLGKHSNLFAFQMVIPKRLNHPVAVFSAFEELRKLGPVCKFDIITQ